ncbi:MAG: hypothetical protein G01um10143_234 [Parcubacteria group bacterium Gr01-1014_3]|nr:MAG: hypothetical protein G01um10143_234 [Parcubacteria group bacterium Gr01-1014_3]
MKQIIAAFLIFAIPKIAYAQEDFSMSGEARVKQFVVMDEPDLMKMDYSSYDSTPDQEVGLSGHFHFWRKLHLDAYPYFWYSQENKIARVGLFGEFHYDLWGDWLDVGFGHHSWHNADEHSPSESGRSQNWFSMELNFWNISLGGENHLDLFLKPLYYVQNAEPAELKTIYDGDESAAYAKISLGAKLNYGSLDLQLWPYAEFSDGPDRYGLKAEISYPLYRGFSAFGDLHYFTIDNEDRWMIGIGIIIRFK